MLDIIIFNVGLGQCIFFNSKDDPYYHMMVDCGNTSSFNPIDKILEWDLLPSEVVNSRERFYLGNLTITNYDEDHFSGLPYLKEQAHIKTIRFPKNLTSAEIRALKDHITEPITELTNLKDTYTYDVPNYNPPYTKKSFWLNKSDFPGETPNTNKLSHLFFVTYMNSTICIPGDMHSSAWPKILLKTGVIELLRATDILVASHHGREDGYHNEVFTYCSPECIILSDDFIRHGTQENMSSLYITKVAGNGIALNGNRERLRKVLTTRHDNHIWIAIDEIGTRTYKTIL